jgi:PQQ-dependent catabolism-associated beta-propeller protein
VIDSTTRKGRISGAAARRVVGIFAALLVAACTGGKDARSAGDSAAAAPETAHAVAPHGVGELAYVTNEEGRTLTVIQTSNDSVVATIEVGTRPRGVRVGRDGRMVYVALSGSPRCPPTMPDAECAKLKSDKTKDGIAEVDATTGKVVRVLPGGSDPEQFDVSADGKRLYVSNEDAGVATVVDLGSGRIVSQAKVGGEPEGVRVSPDGKTVYVTSESDHAIVALDAESGQVKGRTTVDSRPRDLAFSPDGRRLYASAEVGGNVSVIDATNGREITRITMPKGSKPMGLAVSPNGERLYVATGRGGLIVAVDTRTDKVVDSVKVGTRPWGIALTGDGRKLYAANGPSNDVSVVATDSLRVLTTIKAGALPWGVAIRKP